MLVAVGADASYLTITDVTPGWNCNLNPSGALGVNATGQATGPGTNPTGGVATFFWDGSTCTDLGHAGFSSQARGMGINNAGTAVGWGLVPLKAWYKTASGPMTRCPTWPAAPLPRPSPSTMPAKLAAIPTGRASTTP